MRLLLTRTPRRLLPLVWVVTLLVGSGAATPRLRAVHRDRAARATAQRLGATRPGDRARTIAPDPITARCRPTAWPAANRAAPVVSPR